MVNVPRSTIMLWADKLNGAIDTKLVIQIRATLSRRSRNNMPIFDWDSTCAGEFWVISIEVSECS